MCVVANYSPRCQTKYLKVFNIRFYVVGDVILAVKVIEMSFVQQLFPLRNNPRNIEDNGVVKL